MREDRPSATAQKVAIRRAAHQLLDDPPVFADPLALKMIGHRARVTLESGRFQTVASRSLRAFMAARSQFAREELAAAVERGIRQCVILGAGLDTFAYQNPYAGLRVFEVDHPATQKWKRGRLEQEGITVPESLTFAPVNFERETFADALEHVGFKRGEPAFFSWLGVTPYLARETTLATLCTIRKMCESSAVVFDFAVPRERLNAAHRVAFDLIAGRVAQVGEPFQGFFDPEELGAELNAMGFARVEDLDPGAINARYFAGRTDGLKVSGALAHLVSAGPAAESHSGLIVETPGPSTSQS